MLATARRRRSPGSSWRSSSSDGSSTHFLNSRSARKEVGSEIELAANRKPYYDDEVLEGKRLERVQLIGVLLLVVIVIGLPLYWVLEPSRQAGATEGIEKRLAGWGEGLVRSRPPTAASTAPAATAA